MNRFTVPEPIHLTAALSRTRLAPVLAILALSACAGAPSPSLRATPANAAAQPDSPSELPPPPQVESQQPGTWMSPPDSGESDSSRVSQSDLDQRALELFGDSAAAQHSDTSPSWDIDVHSYEGMSSVERYVRLFSGSAKERVQAQLERGTAYEPMIRAKMREGGVPEDMYYLALIESGFDPNAYSRAAAVGMWQFMTSTARGMGLRVDWWIDERRDPVRSTVAAIRFIKGLQQQFGSLYLAAAAYNGGPGRVARGLSRYADDLEGTSGDDLFFALAEKNYLRSETREYVPQLIAAALIAKEPERYGMTIKAQPPFVFDTVRVGPATPLAAIADAAGITVPSLLDLNPQILRGVTPPSDSVVVRIPPGMADSFAVAFSGLPKSERLGLRTVRSKRGDSFATIARRQGISSRQLALYNRKAKLYKSGKLMTGQRILVPTAAVISAAVAVPDPSIERYSGSRVTRTHVVRSGETLSGIALRYHMTTSALKRRNHLRKDLIFPGQSLVVSGSTATRTRASSKKATTRKTTARKPVAKKSVAKKP